MAEVAAAPAAAERPRTRGYAKFTHPDHPDTEAKRAFFAPSYKQQRRGAKRKAIAPPPLDDGDAGGGGGGKEAKVDVADGKEEKKAAFVALVPIRPMQVKGRPVANYEDLLAWPHSFLVVAPPERDPDGNVILSDVVKMVASTSCFAHYAFEKIIGFCQVQDLAQLRKVNKHLKVRSDKEIEVSPPLYLFVKGCVLMVWGWDRRIGLMPLMARGLRYYEDCGASILILIAILSIGLNDSCKINCPFFVRLP